MLLLDQRGDEFCQPFGRFFRQEVATRVEHVDRRAANGLMQSPCGAKRQKGIVRTMNDGGGRRHGAKARADLNGVRAVEGFEMRDKQITSGGCREILDVAIDRSLCEFVVHESAREIGFEHTEQPSGRKMARQWQCSARHFHFAGWPFVEGHAVHKAEM